MLFRSTAEALKQERYLYLAQAGPPMMTSIDPCSEIYRGPSPASEPETTNVTALLDRFPSLGYFIDVHSFGEDILYNWGDDDDQTTDPAMNFRNPAYDGHRGIPDATPGGDPGKYREYVPPADLDTLVALGDTMREAIAAAHGRRYSVKGAVGLDATSGTSDDYAYSRSFLGTGHGKVLGYTIEWGPQQASIPQSFHLRYRGTWCLVFETLLVRMPAAFAVDCRLDAESAVAKIPRSVHPDGGPSLRLM